MKKEDTEEQRSMKTEDTDIDHCYRDYFPILFGVRLTLTIFYIC